MTATLKTDVVQDTSGSTANLTLATSGAVTVGGALTVTSGTINGTTIGASSATTANFTNVIATEVKATAGSQLSLKEDSGSTIIAIPTNGSVELLPAATMPITLGANSTNSITAPTGHGQDRHSGESVELNAKVTGVGYRSGSTSSSTAKAVGAMYAGITGEIKMYAGQYEPEGWVFCDGSSYDGGATTAYKNLYDVIGTTYGNGGGGSNMFNVPDLRGRVPAGMDDMNSDQGTGGGNAGRLTTGTLGASGGTENVTLTANQSGLKAHTVTVPAMTTNSQSTTTTSDQSQNHFHDAGFRFRTLNIHSGGNATHAETDQDTHNTSNASNGHTHQFSHTHTTPQTNISISGVDAANSHTNLQPYLCVNYIIKL